MKNIVYIALLLAILSCKKEKPIAQEESSEPPSDEYVHRLVQQQRIQKEVVRESFNALWVNSCYPEGVSMEGSMSRIFFQFEYHGFLYSVTSWKYDKVVGTGLVSQLTYKGVGELMNVQQTFQGYVLSRVSYYGKWKTDHGNAIILNQRISYKQPILNGVINGSTYDYVNLDKSSCN